MLVCQCICIELFIIVLCMHNYVCCCKLMRVHIVCCVKTVLYSRSNLNVCVFIICIRGTLGVSGSLWVDVKYETALNYYIVCYILYI